MINKLYSFDFDGVICDSAIETGMAGWKVAVQLWPDMPATLPKALLDQFRLVRPVMETGFEAILIMRCLHEGVTSQQLLNHFNSTIDRLLHRDQLSADDLKQRFGEARDHWLNEDADQWLAMNPLFSGMAQKLKMLDNRQTFIITTKQERFVSQIFAGHHISFPAEQIYGLDRQQTKTDTLAELSQSYPNYSLLFVEDRLATLRQVIDDPRLHHLHLFFADWGYNTAKDKAVAATLDRIDTLSLQNLQAL